MTSKLEFIDQTRQSTEWDMQALQANGSLFGGLSDLLFLFCEAKQITAPEKLQHIQHLERFDYQTWRDILSLLDQQLQRPALGLEIAQHLKLKHLGVLGYLAQSSHNLGEALQRYYDFHRLIYDGNPLMVIQQQDLLAIRWDFPKILTTQVTNEVAIALMYQFLKCFLHVDDIELREVHFQHPAPKSIVLYEQYFHCKVRFSQPHAQIHFSANMLTKPLMHADSTLQDLLLKQANALLASLPLSTQLDERLQHAILVGLQQQQCNLEDISKQMQLSIRQLQRHLQQQGVSYQQRVQQVKLMLAQQYLQDPYLSLPEIAVLLGYSEQSAFQRAFKKWTLQTPQNWRRLQQNE